MVTSGHQWPIMFFRFFIVQLRSAAAQFSGVKKGTVLYLCAQFANKTTCKALIFIAVASFDNSFIDILSWTSQLTTC